MSYDYYKHFKYGSDKEYVASICREYNDMFGPPIRVYRLDKELTKNNVGSSFSPVYGENTRPDGYIYLSAIKMKINREDVMMAQELNKMGLLDNPEMMEISLSLGHMIDKMTEAKESHESDIFILSGNTGYTSISIDNGYFNIDGETSGIPLDDLTMSSLALKLKNMGFSVNWTGKNICAIELENFAPVDCSAQKVNFYKKNDTYKNVSDVVEAGDLIIDHNNALHVVTQAYLGDALTWNYYDYHLRLKRVSLQGIKLPDDDNKIVRDDYIFDKENIGNENG